jgi:hypothetical protein
MANGLRYAQIPVWETTISRREKRAATIPLEERKRQMSTSHIPAPKPTGYPLGLWFEGTSANTPPCARIAPAVRKALAVFSDKPRELGIGDIRIDFEDFADLGTHDIDTHAFARLYTERTVREIIPDALREAALADEARRCEEDPSPGTIRAVHAVAYARCANSWINGLAARAASSAVAAYAILDGDVDASLAYGRSSVAMGAYYHDVDAANSAAWAAIDVAIALRSPGPVLRSIAIIREVVLELRNGQY